MKIVTFSEHLHGIGLLSSALIYPGTFLQANRPYLFTSDQYDKLLNGFLTTITLRVSDAWPLLRELHAKKDGEGQTVLLYNNVGGIGDNIMMWPLARILHKRGYKVHVLVRPGYELFWAGYPWLESIISTPISWEIVRSFQAHAFFEFLTNFYMHPDQGHPLDIMLAKVGIDPAEIPASEKRVVPEFTFWENEMSCKLYEGKRIAFFQLSASQRSRSLAPDHARGLLTALAKAFPYIHWIATYGGKTDSTYYQSVISGPNLECRTFEKVRLLWALIRRAEVCVSPDSMMVHAAGTQGIPCVGLWGTHNPETRVLYYPNHYPIYLSETCPKSPCYWNGRKMPVFCPDEIPDRTRCGLLQAITPDILVKKVREVLATVRRNKISGTRETKNGLAL